MKKILLSLLCIFSVFTLFAQTVETETTAEPKSSTEASSVERQHLTFKGIPIDGTPEEFGRKLEAVGFEYNYKSQGSYWYKGGSFAGYSDCEVIVKAYDNLVYEVVVLLPTKYGWSHLYGDYSSLVYSLTKKYGEPIYKTEEFVNTPSYIDISDDNDKYSEVMDNHCKYYCAFRDAPGWGYNGTIHIEIKATGRVGLHYTDWYNEYLKKQAVVNDL